MSRLPTLARSAAVALAATAALALTACSGGAHGSGYTFEHATKTGQLIAVGQRKPAEDVGGTLLSGGKTTLDAYKGKVVVLNFWASWCGPCTVETPQFDVMYRQLKASGVQVLGVNTKNEKGPANAFVSNNDISFPNIYDEDGKVLLQLGNIPSAGLPVTVLVDKSQRVAAVYVGRLAVKQVEPAVLKLRAET